MTEFQQMLEKQTEQTQNQIDSLSYNLTESMKDMWSDEKLDKDEILEANLIALDNMGIIPSGSTDKLLNIIQIMNGHKSEFLQEKKIRIFTKGS